MSIFYVDISVENDLNTTYNGTTELVPLTYTNFISQFLSEDSPDIYRIRGKRNVPDAVELRSPNIGASLEAWNQGVYGPWRLNVDSIAIHCNLADALIEANDAGASLLLGGFENSSIAIKNSHLKTLGWILCEVDKDQIFKGCNLVSGSDIKLYYGTSYNITKSFVDSVIEANFVIDDLSGVFTDTLFMENCSLSMSEIDFNIAVTDPELDVEKQFCQFALPSIDWPTWEGTEEEWKYTEIGDRITVSGSGTYTGYPFGLFGYARTGIGAFSFKLPVDVEYGNFIFAEKLEGVINSDLIVVNNAVSRMLLEVNADIVANNMTTNEPIFVRANTTIEEADYNLNDLEGQKAIGITPDISNTASIDPDIPAMLEEDLYRKKRSQLIETGDNSADGGAIEVNYLDDKKTYQDIADINNAVLTPQGRNLMARMTIGQASCQIIGFAIGRGGYEYHNPVKVLPIDTKSDNARGWILLKANLFTETDRIEIQGHLIWKTTFKPKIYESDVDVPSTHTYYFAIGSTIIETLENIAIKMNNTPEIYDTVHVVRENDTIQLIAVPCGTIGNTIWYTAIGIPFKTPHTSPLIGGAFIGGVDENFSNSIIDLLHEGNVDGENCILEYANPAALVTTVKLHPNLGLNAAIGEFALKARISQSNFASEVGTEFAFAIGHHPIQTVHSKYICVKRFVIQL